MSIGFRMDAVHKLLVSHYGVWTRFDDDDDDDDDDDHDGQGDEEEETVER
jgi:hypothetical protein